MPRFEFVAAAAAVVMGFVLTGCASMPSTPGWMTPSWMSSKSTAPAMQSMRFESDPPGAEVHTAQGQACKTPCELMVPSEIQSVSIAKKGFVSQTIQVGVGDPPKHSFWESPPPTLVPSPVQVVLMPFHHPAKQANVQPAGAGGTVR
jgi:hypothetical protein